MEIYDYSKINNCIICGKLTENGLDKFIKKVVNSLPSTNSFKCEIHPKEVERQKRLAQMREEESSNDVVGGEDLYAMLHPTYTSAFSKKKKSVYSDFNLANTLLVVCGSSMFGTKDLNYFRNKLENLNNVLCENNSHIAFIRSSDDPKYFDEQLIEFSNIRLVKDYSILKLSKFNCLCIGGCISNDRSWKIEQEKRMGKKLYWEGEMMTYDEGVIDEICKKNKIACVISLSCPSFCQPSMNSIKKSVWSTNDKKLFRDIKEERIILDKVYNKLIENGVKPYIWVYGNFKMELQNIINDILFQSLEPFRFFHFNETVTRFFGIDFSKSLQENVYVAQNPLEGKKIKAVNDFSFEMPFGYSHDINNGEVLEEVVDGDDFDLVQEAPRNTAVEGVGVNVNDIMERVQAHFNQAIVRNN